MKKKLSEAVAELENNFEFYYKEHLDIIEKCKDLEDRNKTLTEDADFIASTMRYWNNKATNRLLLLILTWGFIISTFGGWLAFCPTGQQPRDYLVHQIGSLFNG